VFESCVKCTHFVLIFNS